MNLKINIIDKPEKNVEEEIQLKSSSDVVELKDVQAIRNAMREHLLFIGLDRANHIRNISLLGIGSTCNVVIDTKEIIRTALFSASDKVILVHNHPSNSIQPSASDLHLTNVTKQILDVFNIELIDHIIVTEKDYICMQKINKIAKEYNSEPIQTMTKGFLIEENERLKKEIEDLKLQLELKNYNIEDSVEEMITNISDLDDKHYFTVARVMENGKCVELHYDNGKAKIEYGIKMSEDMWKNEINDNVEWFSLNLTEEEILEHLNKEFDNYFVEKENDFDLDIAM